MAYKSMVIPFVGVIAIVAQLLFGIELSEELQSEIASAIANLVAVGAVVYGIVKSNIKKKE